MGGVSVLFRAGVVAALVLTVYAAAPRPATATEGRSLRAELRLDRRAFQSGEEIVARVALTNTSPPGRGDSSTIFLPQALRSASFDLVGLLDGRPVRAQAGGAVTGLRLTFPGHPPLPPLLDIPGAGPPLVAPSMPWSNTSGRAFTGALRPGETARTDTELLSEYGVLPPGGYRLRFSYVGETGTVISDWVPFSVFRAGPVTERERQAYEELAAEPNPEAALVKGREFLSLAPGSIYASRARRRMVDAALALRQWRLVLRLGGPLLTSRAAPMWHHPREAVGIAVATALWHMGRTGEAEAVLLAVNPEEYGVLLQRIRGGGR